MHKVLRKFSISKPFVSKIFTACIFLIALFTVGSCHPGDNFLSAYRRIGAGLNKDFNLTRSDLIVAYDLGRIDDSDCIYAQDLGLIINSQTYQDEYLNKFRKYFKSPSILRKEAISKVLRITNLLISLQKEHKILSNNEHQYVKGLREADLRKMDARFELSKLDRIIQYIPVMSPEYSVQISSHYGKRYHPVERCSKFHSGIDLHSKTAAPIFSSATGRVVFAGNMNGYGKVVEIEHGRGIKTRYAHLRHVSVRKGQNVSRGQLIGRQGKSGNVTNEHLHFEIWINNKHVNPYSFISLACKCQK